MAARDRRVDAYIAKSADFAKPILTHLREVVHSACPSVEETIKWGFPVFMYHGMLCSMAAFKQHATFGFWKQALIPAVGGAGDRGAMGQFGRLTSVKDLPSRRILTGLITSAMQLNEDGVKVARPKRAPRPAPAVPPDLQAALRQNKKAAATYAAFSPSHQREYVEWITEAKTDATRERRIGTAVEWMAEGKPRNWKYLDC